MQPDTARERQGPGGAVEDTTDTADVADTTGAVDTAAGSLRRHSPTPAPACARRPPAPAPIKKKVHKKGWGVWWIHTTKHPTSMGPKTKGKQ